MGNEADVTVAEVSRRLAQANAVDVLIARRRRVADFSLRAERLQ